MLLDIEADVIGSEIRLDLGCGFHAFRLESRHSTRTYYAAAAGASVQIQVDGGAIIEYSRSLELPPRYRTEDQRVQQRRLVLRAAAGEAGGAPHQRVREAGETVALASDFVSNERLLTGELDDSTLTWRLVSTLGSGMSQDLVMGHLFLSATVLWPAHTEVRTGTIRFIPELMQIYSAQGKPFGTLKSSLMRYCLAGADVVFHGLGGIQIRFEVRSP